MSIELVMPSNYLILCHPLLLLPSNFPSIRVFSNESVLRIRWPKYRSFSFSISPSNEHPGLISFGWTGWISLQSKGLSRVFSGNTVQSINSLVLSFLYSPTLWLYCCLFGSCNQVAFPGDNSSASLSCSGACILYFWLSMLCSSALYFYE